jgi:Flp pilus assembly protein TadD
VAVYAAVILVTFALSLTCGFVWIDHVEIEEGGYRVTSVDDASLLLSSSLDQYAERHTGSDSTAGGYFRPVYALSISLDWMLFGRNPVFYHLENLMWHLLVVLLLHAVGRQLLGRSDDYALVPFIAALLFAVHPLAVHSVTWISGRKDLLCTAFGTASLLAFGIAGRLDGREARRAGLAMIMCPVLLALAILSKELAYVVPLFAGVWWWCCHDRAEQDPQALKRARVSLAMMWCVVAVGLMHRLIALGTLGLDANAQGHSLQTTMLTSSSLMTEYLTDVLLPLKTTIVDRWPLISDISIGSLIPLCGLLLSVGALAYGVHKRNRAALLGAWTAVWLLPASGLVPLRHLYAQRYLYPASWGIILLMAYLLCRWYVPGTANEIQRLRKREVLLLMLSVPLAVITFSANRVWKSDDSLFSDAVAQDFAYVEGHTGLAGLALQAEDYSSAQTHSLAALESLQDTSYQSYWSPFILHTNLGLAEYHLGNTEAAEQSFRIAAQSRPNSAISHYHLGLVAISAGQLDVARQELETARQLGNDDFLTLSNLGFVYLQQNQPEEAVQVLAPLIDQQPDNLLNLGNLGSAYLLQKDYAAAENIFETAVQQSPKNVVFLAKLAWAECYLGKTTECSVHFRTAASIDPRQPILQLVAGMIAEQARQQQGDSSPN